MTTKKYLIVEDKHIEIESLTEMSFEPETRSWNNVTITVKEYIQGDLLSEGTGNLYILKDEKFFFIKVASFNIDGKTILIKPKWCTLLNL